MKLLWYSGKISDFRPAVPGSITGGNFFKKSQIFLITKGFQIFWQKTWNQQLLFYYSMRRGKNWIVAPSSDSSSNSYCLQCILHMKMLEAFFRCTFTKLRFVHSIGKYGKPVVYIKSRIFLRKCSQIWYDILFEVF